MQNAFISRLIIGLIWAVILFLPSAASSLPNFPKFRTDLNAKRTLSPSYLEQRLKNYLRNRSIGNNLFNDQSNANTGLNQGDLFYLVKVWNAIDPSLKKAYNESIKIPDSLKSYISPGNNFEVYYSNESDTSTIFKDNYSFNKSNWREKQLIPNGIPDYVDEIAYALDSSWALEVENFKFVKPIPFKDLSHNSSRYKVIARKFLSPDEKGIYAFTFPCDNSGNIGWSTIIHINIDFHSLNYDVDPQNAIYVTCAHEFFHTIQYAMIHNLTPDNDLDNFPLAWIEGAATSMEDIAFPFVNDYVQYSNFFFNYPELSLLHDDTASDLTTYTNSLLLLYIYYFSEGKPSIDFVRNVTFNDYTSLIPFNDNIQKSANAIGYSWVDILNRFHAASFFTGSRADTTQFVNDAFLFDQWNYYCDTIYNPIIQKAINSYGMEMFPYRPSSITNSDTLLIHCKSISTSTSAIKNWAASVIIRKDFKDSVIQIPLNINGEGSYQVSDWKSCKELIVIVTNGDPSNSSNYQVSFDNCPVTHKSGETFSVSENASDHKSKATIFVNATADIRCDVALFQSHDEKLKTDISTINMVPICSTYYQIRVPESWEDNSNIKLQISLTSPPDSSLYTICKWDSTNSTWTEMNSTFHLYHDSLVVESNKIVSGIYSVFLKNSTYDFSAFPNPVSLSKKITFSAATINAVYIYNINGQLIYKLLPSEQTRKVVWDLKNRSNNMITPGLYTAIVKYHNAIGGSSKTTNCQILVKP